eukprot:gb/GECG01010647.1/.p1 GENE.gb/GECG01010647.1/~~gb/GECG01010647.1/.p1  ORF type:complete len:1367 (+),score=239.06 gb/GECG01010647.1/:1-4101(+)
MSSSSNGDKKGVPLGAQGNEEYDYEATSISKGSNFAQEVQDDNDDLGHNGAAAGAATEYTTREDDDEEDIDPGLDTGGTHPATKAAIEQQKKRLKGKSSSSGGRGEDAAGAAGIGDDDDPFKSYREGVTGKKDTRLSAKETSYHKRKYERDLSPERVDAFGGKDEGQGRSYKEVMEATQVEREKKEYEQKIAKEQEERERLQERTEQQEDYQQQSAAQAAAERRRKRRRWDTGDTDTDASSVASSTADGGDDAADATPVAGQAQWDKTPAGPEAFGPTPARGGASKWDETPGPRPSVAGQSWETPKAEGAAGATPTPSRKKSRWDETPTPANAALQSAGRAAAALATPNTSTVDMSQMTPALAKQQRLEREMDERNRPLSDEELDAILPSDGYRILDPPANYRPIRTPSRKMMSTPTPALQSGFHMQQTPAKEQYGVTGSAAAPPEGGEASDLPYIKPEDQQFFGALLEEKDEEQLSAEEKKEREIMTLLLKIKNGLPQDRKKALRNLTKRAREFGAGPLFNQILPLMMSPALEEQERHLLVKVIDRVLYKLDDMVRPYVHKILVVVEPMLIDQDYYARVEGREIVSNLAKAAGLAHMIATMRPDIDNVDEYVRNTTARAFAVVASALGIPALLPFLKAVCQSRKSWQARHTGIKIIQQIAILMGCAILPHLSHMVNIIAHGLEDDNSKVRTITALAIAALAESAYPYGIEAFDCVLRPLWQGARQTRDKGLAAILKAIGNIIPLMDAQYAAYYTREVMVTVIREFQSPDEEMKKTVLQVVKQCVSTDGVDSKYVREEILPEFFANFWVRRMAADKRNYQAVVSTTVELANKAGVSEIVNRIVDDLKDENEPYRGMVMSALQEIIKNHGAADIDQPLEVRLVDGLIYSYQEQALEDYAKTILKGFGVIATALGERTKPYLPQIQGTITFRLNNKSARVRMQAADLITEVAHVMKLCGEEDSLAHLGQVLYENLGEEYPEVLGSIIGALKSVASVIGVSRLRPPVNEVLTSLTPILKNRHEKVQEKTIELVGLIADRGANSVHAKEWMRICFDLLELLKAGRKSIRRATVNTFGFIAKAIGPQDVLHTLLNNLRVQERQLRVCTTIAIAIVAETCQPFTVLPALMNEYRVADMNVQNGVLKAMSFMFEYIGEMSKDYIYAVTPLLQDALMSRDMVHRQIACNAVKHIALGVQGLGCEDSLTHLLNYVWPNIFETSPHIMNAVFEAVEALRVSLGPGRIMLHLLQGLYHPARRVREVYWKIYNNAYVYSSDGLVPFYPRLVEDDDRVDKIARAKLQALAQEKNVFVDGESKRQNKKKKTLKKIDHSGATAAETDVVSKVLEEERRQKRENEEQAPTNNYRRTYLELVI